MISWKLGRILVIALVATIVADQDHNCGKCEVETGQKDSDKDAEKPAFQFPIMELIDKIGDMYLKGDADAKTRKHYSEKDRKVQEKQQEGFLYALLKKEGRIAHPDFSYEFYVKKVQGRKLLDIEFMRRDPSGKNYDLVGRASEAELHVDLKEGQILVNVRRLRVVDHQEGVEFRLDEKCLPMDLPEIPFRNLPRNRRPKSPTWLTTEVKKFLDRETPESEEEPDQSKVGEKLKQAFGDDCQELTRSIQLDLPGQGLLLACNKFESEPDGRIKLTPFSMAKFGKPKKDGESQAIITIRSNYAYLTLDRPISTMFELGNCKNLRIELADSTRLTIDGPEKKK